MCGLIIFVNAQCIINKNKTQPFTYNNNNNIHTHNRRKFNSMTCSKGTNINIFLSSLVLWECGSRGKRKFSNVHSVTVALVSKI